MKQGASQGRHNEVNCVKLGELVQRGQIISLSGSAGDSTGPRVRDEVWKGRTHVNPAPLLEDIP
jgi:murein DD-endopeptidase MepM/ murein hydrolase activator NlpD